MNKILAKALKDNCMTQKELAEKIGYTQQNISKWITSPTAQVPPQARNQIKEMLGVDVYNDDSLNKRKVRFNKNTMKQKHIDFNDLKDIEQATQETKIIIEEADIPEHYSRPVYVMLSLFISSTIGLTYHHYLKYKDDGFEFSLPFVISNFDSFFSECNKSNFENQLDYDFYLMGSDLFESFEKGRLPNHDFIGDSLDLWERFKKLYYGNGEDSRYRDEFNAALTEIIVFYEF